MDGFKPVAPAWSKLTQAERDAKAKELLTEAGFGPGKPLKFELLYNTDDNHKKVAVAVASMWKKLGVQVSLVNQEWKTYLETKQGQFDVGRAGWIADYNEASSMLDLMQTTHGNNDGKYSNPAFDKLMNESRNQVDADARNKLYVQAEDPGQGHADRSHLSVRDLPHGQVLRGRLPGQPAGQPLQQRHVHHCSLSKVTRRITKQARRMAGLYYNRDPLEAVQDRNCLC